MRSAAVSARQPSGTAADRERLRDGGWRSDERSVDGQPGADTTSLGTGMGTSPDGPLGIHA